MLDTSNLSSQAKTTVIALVNFLYIIAVYVGLNHDAMQALTILFVLDFITGIMKSYRLDDQITSNKIKLGLVSKALLLLVPVAIALLLKAVSIDTHHLIEAVIGILALSEAYSIIGNIYSFRTQKRVEEIDALAIILSKLKTYVERLFPDGSRNKKDNGKS